MNLHVAVASLLAVRSQPFLVGDLKDQLEVRGDNQEEIKIERANASDAAGIRADRRAQGFFTPEEARVIARQEALRANVSGNVPLRNEGAGAQFVAE